MSALGLFNRHIFQRKTPNEVQIRRAVKLHRKLQATLLKLERRREASWRRIRECGARHDFPDMMQHVEEATAIVKQERLLRSLGPSTVGRNHFILSSLMLIDSLRVLIDTSRVPREKGSQNCSSTIDASARRSPTARRSLRRTGTPVRLSICRMRSTPVSR